MACTEGACRSFTWLSRGRFEPRPMASRIPEAASWDLGARQIHGRPAPSVEAPRIAMAPSPSSGVDNAPEISGFRPAVPRIACAPLESAARIRVGEPSDVGSAGQRLPPRSGPPSSSSLATPSWPRPPGEYGGARQGARPLRPRSVETGSPLPRDLLRRCGAPGDARRGRCRAAELARRELRTPWSRARE